MSEPTSGAEAAPAPEAKEERSAPHSRLLLVFHSVAFGAIYLGVGQSAIPGHVPAWFPGQRISGTVVILAGGALMAWAMATFQSWRFRAKLDEGHQLATGGPFRLFRHPIYLALDLLALGTAVWIPSAACWIGFVLMVIGSDLRARAEESLLRETFGRLYLDYCARTRRFIPGVY